MGAVPKFIRDAHSQFTELHCVSGPEATSFEIWSPLRDLLSRNQKAKDLLIPKGMMVNEYIREILSEDARVCYLQSFRKQKYHKGAFLVYRHFAGTIVHPSHNKESIFKIELLISDPRLIDQNFGSSLVARVERQLKNTRLIAHPEDINSGRVERLALEANNAKVRLVSSWERGGAVFEGMVL